MASLLNLASIGSSVGGMIMDGVNAYNQNKISQQMIDNDNRNLEFQLQNYEYQKSLNQELMNREDTSYQRTVKDMRSAGLSPLAMSGLNGSGGSVSSPNAPLISNEGLSAKQASKQNAILNRQVREQQAMTNAQTIAGIANTNAQTENVKLLNLNQKMANEYQELQIVAELKKLKADTDSIDVRKSIDKAIDDWQKKNDMPYNSNPIISLVGSLTPEAPKNMVKNGVEFIKQGMEDNKNVASALTNPDNYKSVVDETKEYFRSDEFKNSGYHPKNWKQSFKNYWKDNYWYKKFHKDK